MPATKMEKAEGTVRERLLSAADELFYAEGIHTVGIDRILSKAGVAKASLYGTFGSKDELVRAYMEGRAAARQARIETRLARVEGARPRILAVFDLLLERLEDPSFRGCAFLNATAEGSPEECKVRDVALGTRAWVRNLFETLSAELGVEDPEKTAQRLQLFYDGAMTAASMERDRAVVAEARALAEELLDAHAPKAARKLAKSRK